VATLIAKIFLLTVNMFSELKESPQKIIPHFVIMRKQAK
jgi:hypothetical protein